MHDLCREMHHEICADGTELFAQGDEGTTFYIIFRGSCKLYAIDEGLVRKQTLLATLDAGASFGELALLNAAGHSRRSASAIVSGPSILFTLEMCLKIVVFGFVYSKDAKDDKGEPLRPAYLRVGWNQLDFLIVFISILVGGAALERAPRACTHARYTQADATPATLAKTDVRARARPHVHRIRSACARALVRV